MMIRPKVTDDPIDEGSVYFIDDFGGDIFLDVILRDDPGKGEMVSLSADLGSTYRGNVEFREIYIDEHVNREYQKVEKVI